MMKVVQVSLKILNLWELGELLKGQEIKLKRLGRVRLVKGGLDLGNVFPPREGYIKLERR